MKILDEIKVGYEYLKSRGPFILYFYLTYKCNSRCVYCDIKDREPVEADPSVVKNILTEFRKLGGKIVILTGGEPLLYPYLREILLHARKLNLKSIITTNGILYLQKWRELRGVVDQLEFSLPTLDPEIYKRERGVELFEKTKEAVVIAKKIGENPILSVTLTNENIHKLDSLIKWAKSYSIKIILKPEFSFVGNGGLKADFIDKIKSFNILDGVWYNRAYIEFYKRGGNSILKPRCRALHSTIAISPKISLMLPCYHYSIKEIVVKGGLKEALESNEVKEIKEKVGQFQFCNGCKINCYFEDSFLRRVDKLFLYDILSRIEFLFLR